jgi:hypothetical protein
MRSRKTPRADVRRALVVLAGSPKGCTEAALLAHGFDGKIICDLIEAKLATAQRAPMPVGKGATGIARLRITAAGRQVIKPFGK